MKALKKISTTSLTAMRSSFSPPARVTLPSPDDPFAQSFDTLNCNLC
jgi:hypothetical protein